MIAIFPQYQATEKAIEQKESEGQTVDTEVPDSDHLRSAGNHIEPFVEERESFSPLAQHIAQVAAQLSHSKNSSENAALLEELRDDLESSDREEAVMAIRQYLASGQDAETRLIFKIWKGGVLRNAPTMRVFLIDQLGRMDTQSAADEARNVLQSLSVPDEWAVSLRNLAWAEGKSDELIELTREMLTHEPWLEAPSRGFLEAFDLIVYNNDVELVPNLAAHIAPESSKALNHIGFMTMDRLVINEPTVVYDWLLQNPSSMDTRPYTRAGFFARADLGDHIQRNQVEAYLNHPSISDKEREYYYKLFPNNDLMLSYNLLTPTEGFPQDFLNNRTATSVDAALEWQKNDTIPEADRPHLEEALDRLD